ncbi:FAD-dependent oxidoreductase [Phaeobacter sp. J2-8]|uniref:NAD(P)/FAD-dependent oxidoreductase n=1 Tax=Phaeobacter sp. J2-8 TaxID=2931394 RepID=UPI001FD1AB5A|nr:FAD-dependent oxidoreductase [Phaeobacter sp. J2-8]MCJ7871184.1 FAD-binding oxidoreductase [Phaeobacter sp. J2-8]
MNTERAEICIIGGGIQGCAAALELARRGHDVIVIEKDYPGRQSSGVNAGGVRRLNRALPEIPLSVASHKIWERIADHVGDDCGFTKSATIMVCETTEELENAKARAAETRALGYTHEQIISDSEVHKHLPKLDGQVTGALQGIGDGFASPFRTTQAFFRTALQDGARFFLGHRVEQISRSGHWIVETRDSRFEAEILINCAGAWGNQVAGSVGDPTPVHAEAPMMTITAPVPHVTDAVVAFTGRRLSFKQRHNGTLLIGGGYRGHVNPDGYSSRLALDKLAMNARAVLDLFSHLKDVPVVRSWAGVEGMTPDHMPIIGPSLNEDGLFHAFGFLSHGFQLGPIVGQILAELVETGTTDLPIEPLSIRRFR